MHVEKEVPQHVIYDTWDILRWSHLYECHFLKQLRSDSKQKYISHRVHLYRVRCLGSLSFLHKSQYPRSSWSTKLNWWGALTFSCCCGDTNWASGSPFSWHNSVTSTSRNFLWVTFFRSSGKCRLYNMYVFVTITSMKCRNNVLHYFFVFRREL